MFKWICDSDLVVASPVEDYFLYVNELPESEKVWQHVFLCYVISVYILQNIFLKFKVWQKKAEQVTKPILNALGDDYSVCCQGMI